MIVLAGLCLVAAVAAPHLLSLERARPSTAAVIWVAALCLRALIVLLVILGLVLFVPATAVFDVVTHWCWHTAVPLVVSHLDLSGHDLGDVALLAPVLAASASLLWVCLGVWRGTRAIGAWVRRSSIGPGPQQSLLVGGLEIVVAAAGLRRPRVIVSAGALTSLDDDELAASLDHEHGHIARRHRFVLILAELSRALARLLPGTRHAVAELIFHLERDADRWALRREHDPAALASAICKAAAAPERVPAAALTALGGGSVVRRVRQLLEHAPAAPHAGAELLAVAMVAMVLAVGAVVPVAARAGVAVAASTDVERHCPS